MDDKHKLETPPAALVDITESVTVQIENDAGKILSREVYRYIDVRAFRGTAIYPWMVMAANPHLSCPDLSRILEMANVNTPGAYRPAHWLRRRRGMTLPPNAALRNPNRPDRDGKQAKALAIMDANPGLSLRDLTRLLREHGIVRSREWLRSRRYTARLSDNH